MPDFLAEARSLEDRVAGLRHDLHEYPEIALELPKTQARVLKALEGLPLEISTGRQLTSITAVLRGGAAPERIEDRPVVLLRADMDALRIPEDTGMAFSSKTEGHMHGCGHDIHTATLVGAVHLLAAHQRELPGDVVFMFQPGEEVFKGARLMIDEGVLDAAGKRVDRAFAMHVFSALFPSRMFATKPGTALAAADVMKFDVVGTGGHGSTPWAANDPVPVMAEIIMGLQTLATKKFNAFDPVVINVGVANAGGAPNIIPERCHAECAIRTFSLAHREKMEQVAQQLVRGICEAHGMTAEITWDPGVPPTLCDEEVTAFVDAQITGLFGPERHYHLDTPLAGSEDFSEVLKLVPGSFVMYSGVPEDRDLATATFNHSATAWFDDSVLPEATALYAQLGYAALHELAGAKVSV